jgi:hypothetical protein
MRCRLYLDCSSPEAVQLWDSSKVDWRRGQEADRVSIRYGFPLVFWSLVGIEFQLTLIDRFSGSHIAIPAASEGPIQDGAEGLTSDWGIDNLSIYCQNVSILWRPGGFCPCRRNSYPRAA